MERKPTLLMMKGLPCSGKTEWALAWVAARRVLAFETAIHLMLQALKAGNDVVIDECNLIGYTIGLFVARAQMVGATVKWHTMETTPEECKRRNAAAGHPVDDMEIDRLAKAYAPWLKQ